MSYRVCRQLSEQELRQLQALYAPTGPRRRWSDTDDIICRKLRGDNYSIRAIADIMNCSTTSVQKSLRGAQ